MPLIFRDTKGSPLTSTEADANVRQLSVRSDPRKDLVTINGNRTNTLVFEGRYVLSNPVLGPNVSSFSAQVIKAATAPAVAYSVSRNGTPTDVLNQINADIATLLTTDLALYYVRFITFPVNAPDEAHLILTVLPF